MFVGVWPVVSPFVSRVRVPRRPSVRVRGEIVSDDVKLIKAKHRRDSLVERGLCINGEKHGAATHGRRCLWCAAVHRYGIETVHAIVAAGDSLADLFLTPPTVAARDAA